MPIVSINFRGSDQPGYAALLDRELAAEFGRDLVFLSSRSIRPGDEFPTQILNAVRTSAVLLVVIGPQWLTYGAVGDADRPGVDWVRREIVEAFAHRVRVIPILTEGATMPAESELASDLAALASCQYLRLHHRNIDHDLARILEEITRVAPVQLRRGMADDLTWYELSGLHRSPCRIGIFPGTIRRMRAADTWVNSENTDMEMARTTEFSISGIIRYWGARRDESGRVLADVIADELAERVGAQRPVPPCAVYVTGAGALRESHNVRHILHLAAVHGEPGAGFRQVRNIGLCVANALATADRLAQQDQSVRSVLFPLLGTGVGGAEVRPTAVTMLEAIVDYLRTRPDTALRTVYLLASTNDERRVVEDVAAESDFLAPVDLG